MNSLAEIQKARFGLLRQEVQIEADTVRALDKRLAERKFAHFVRRAWEILEPGRPLKWNWSIDLIAQFLQDFARRRFHRGIINVPPRTMKSLLINVMYPAWVWAQDPEKNPHAGPAHQFLCISNGDDLALRDAVAMRAIVESDWYQGHWGDKVIISADQNEKKYFRNSQNGHRNSRSLSGKITGKGGDTVLVDDPQDAEKAQSDVELAGDIEAWDTKMPTRLNNYETGGILLIMQRLNYGDMTAHFINKTGLAVNGDGRSGRWVHLVLPMEFEEDEEGKPPVNPAKWWGYKDQRTKPGELLWKNRFSRATVDLLTKELGSYNAPGQLQQRPGRKGGGIIKDYWWRRWPDDKPFPEIEHMFASWDTAYTEREIKENAYSAMTLWGVWWSEQEQCWNLLLLYAWWDQVDYADLRKMALETHRDYQLDSQLVEKKASGISLLQDLRRAHILARGYNPDREKVARAYTASVMFEAGRVWAPERKWADKVIELVAQAPNGAPPSWDLTDTCTQAVHYVRNGYWIHHPDDDEPEVEERKTREVRSAYG